VDWAEHAYFRLEKPYRVHNLYGSPSWLERFSGDHPPQVIQMMVDVLAGATRVTARRADDVEDLLSRPWYSTGREALIAADYAERALTLVKASARNTRIFRAIRPWLKRSTKTDV
jgi:hypothetical protein